MKLKNILDKYHLYIFLAILLIFYIIIDYFSILFKDPQGIHFIRQTDSLSFAANYLRNGFSFFSPGVFNQNSIEGRAGCEFPIIYYITAIFYKIFGEHEFFLRIINFSINTTGVILLYNLIHKAFKDVIYSLLFTFIFISSMVFLYYANNYLPDSSAFGLTIIGWYYFYKYLTNDNKTKIIVISFIFFGLASLIKITYFINPFATLLSLLTLDFFNKIKFIDTIKKNKFAIISVVAILLLIISWSLYVTYYNEKYGDHYFLITANPFWKISEENKQIVWGVLTYKNGVLKYIYTIHTFYMFMYISISSLFFIKYSDKRILIPTIFVTTGSIFYFFLFFGQLKHHDYYLLVFLIPLFFIITNSIVTLKNRFPNTNHIFPKLIILILLISNFERESLHLKNRYTNVKSWDAHSQISYIIKENNLKYIVDSIGIAKNANFVIMKDITPNGGLLFLKHPGWNIGGIGSLVEKDIEKLNNMKDFDINYILYTKKKYLDYDIIFNQKQVYQNGEISIYKVLK